MRFAYLRDPLFLASFVAYWAHRWLAAHGLTTDLLRSHLNDVICIPLFVPILVWVNRRLGLRWHDGPPSTSEIVIPLIVWAVLFEVVLPSQRAWHVPTIADPKDVLAYCLGGAAAAAFWHWRYRSHGHSDEAADRAAAEVS